MGTVAASCDTVEIVAGATSAKSPPVVIAQHCAWLEVVGGGHDELQQSDATA